MESQEFVNYYENLEVSQNANSETIERVFRFLAKRYHPDVAKSGDMKRFSQLVDAYNVLKDPVARAAYDAELKNHQENTANLVSEASAADEDCLDRHRILTLFYAQRRRDLKQPGIGVATLEQAFDFPPEILNFHLWYFREKGWIQREESGHLSITAAGVDEIEHRIREAAHSKTKKIADQSHRLSDRSQPTAPLPA